MNNILDDLNKEQLAAVTHRNGPLLIIAGAGTGKTTVITRRIAWLISEGICKTNEILALTFTDKAAQEMLERVDTLVPYGYTDIWISTFHAFGDRLLRENSLVAGLDSAFKVLTRPEAAVFFREHLFEFDLSYYRPLSDPTRFVEALISIFSRAKDEDISPQEYLQFARKLSEKAADDPALQEEALQQLEVAKAYLKYQELLAKEGVVDFGNQFYLALKLLREHPLVLKKYRDQFKFILVDEFQDTNFAQYQLARLLSGPDQNFTVAGDDDQCIYRFRGAAYSNLLNFVRDFPQAAKVSLVRNYRSNQLVLDSAYRLIQNNNPERFEVKAGIDKRLIGSSTKGKGPEYLRFDTGSSESDAVARMIRDKAGEGLKYRDFAILVRNNSDARPFLQSLNMLNIPWQFSGNQGLYSREEVKLCINFLRVTANLGDSLNLYYLATSEIYSVPLSEMSFFAHYAKRRNKPLYSVLSSLSQIPDFAEVGEEVKERVSRFLGDLEKFLKLSREETTGRLLYAFLTETGYLKNLTRDPTLEKEVKIRNIARFFGIVRDFELVAREDRVVNFVNYLNLLIDAGDDPPTVEADPDTDAVNVLTIHKAKGLEFRVVFMVCLVSGKFPGANRRQQIEVPDELIKETLPEGDFHLQEERRLFYVGMTRAKEELYLTSAADYGGTRTKRLSQFVSEAMGFDCREAEKKGASALESIQRFAPPKDSPKQENPGYVAPGKVITLSYYQIDDYCTCPLKYKYVNILRVPVMEHHTVIYGRAMHEAVSRYFQERLSGSEMQLDRLLEIFRASFDPQGFLDAKHQEERLKLGQEALVRFFNSESVLRTMPLFIEKEFSFIFEENKITGRLDRVDKRGDKVTIMDFKTSEVKTQKDADRRVRESDQLKLYSLAYKTIYGTLPEEVSLYFLESGIVGTVRVKEEDLEGIKDKVRRVASGIRRQEYPATPGYMSCNYCVYNQICPDAFGTANEPATGARTEKPKKEKARG